MHYQLSVCGMWSNSYEKFVLPVFSRSNGMPPEIDPDLRSQNQESTIFRREWILDGRRYGMKQSYIDDIPRPVIREAMLPLYDAVVMESRCYKTRGWDVNWDQRKKSNRTVYHLWVLSGMSRYNYSSTTGNHKGRWIFHQDRKKHLLLLALVLEPSPSPTPTVKRYRHEQVMRGYEPFRRSCGEVWVQCGWADILIRLAWYGQCCFQPILFGRNIPVILLPWYNGISYDWQTQIRISMTLNLIGSHWTRWQQLMCFCIRV